MNKRYEVWRHYVKIFESDNLQDIKDYMLASGAFKGYEQDIAQAEYGDTEIYLDDRTIHSLNCICTWTEWCMVKDNHPHEQYIDAQGRLPL